MKSTSRLAAQANTLNRFFFRLQSATFSLLPSVFAVALLMVRAAITHGVAYTFLLWNLFLAWTPFVFAVAAAAVRNRPRIRFLQWPLLAMWLLFLPNAPYILTDVVHVLRLGGYVFWYDLVLVFSFALAGLAAGVASMRIVQRLVTESAGTLAGHLVVLTSALLSGVGIYLGRVMRWNSWDLVLQPHVLLPQMARAVANPWHSRHALVFAAMFGVLFAVIAIATLPRSRSAD